MSAADKSAKDKMMAAHLKAQGIFHGVRLSHTNANPIPKMSDVGSAKYRRYMDYLAKGKKSRKHDSRRQQEWQ